MLISLEWLKEYVDIKEDVKELENASDYDRARS